MANTLEELPTELVLELQKFFEQSGYPGALKLFKNIPIVIDGKSVGDILTLIDVASDGKSTNENKRLTEKILIAANKVGLELENNKMPTNRGKSS